MTERSIDAPQRQIRAGSKGQPFGKYLITGRLGQGGMGTVFAATDTRLKRAVALKVLPRSLAADADALRRFVKEAQASARLNHPHVVAIYEIDRQAGITYLAMELVQGGSVDDVLRQRGALPWHEATRILADTCRGLAAAHEAGLIHRDIKPANILCADRGVVKLSDFGLARIAESASIAQGESAAVVGTPHFMSPEQCSGDRLDARSDIYSLGATYFALLTGRPPYIGETALKVMFAHCSHAVPDPRTVQPDIPATCAAIVRRAMAKEPVERYQSAAEMLQALMTALAERESQGSSRQVQVRQRPRTATAACEPPPLPRKRPLGGTRRRLLALGAAVFVLAFLGAWAGGSLGRAPRAPSDGEVVHGQSLPPRGPDVPWRAHPGPGPDDHGHHFQHRGPDVPWREHRGPGPADDSHEPPEGPLLHADRPLPQGPRMPPGAQPPRAGGPPFTPRDARPGDKP